VDANGSRFHFFLTRNDWGRWKFDGVALADQWQHASPPGAQPPVAWNEAAAELTLRPLLFRFLAAPADVKPERARRRGAAADRFGNVYWIDDSGRGIHVQSIGSGNTAAFWPGVGDPAPVARGDFQAPRAPAEPLALAGLAVTEDHYLVVGVLDPGKGVLIFDLFSGGPPSRLQWPSAIPFEPFDIATRPGGGVWILDRTHGRYWGLDRHFNVLRDESQEQTLSEAAQDTFQAPETTQPRGTSQQTFPTGIDYDNASPIDVTDAFAIEALPDGSVLILDSESSSGSSRILRYCFARRLGEPVSLAAVGALIEEGENRDFNLTVHDFTYVPANAKSGEPDQLVVASSEGNQAFSLHMRIDNEQLILEPLPKYFPMRRFGGKGLLLAGTTVFYDFDEGWVPLTMQKRPRYATQAVIESRVAQADTPGDFDSGEPDCVWHRLMLDANIPPDTRVEFWSRAANDRATLLASEWYREPALYRRGDGSELPWAPTHPRRCNIDSQNLAYGTWELLFQRARGRFLQLRLVLTGNERVTPKLRGLRVWYPRFSYVEKYLPAVYREDALSGGFLERFLANLEGFHTALEDRITNVRTLFDWRSAPAEALNWLARWFDISLDPAWDEHRRRLFVRHAAHFFQYRGTIHGLRMALGLALDQDVGECEFEGPGRIPESRQRVRIIERYATRRTAGIVFGDPQLAAGPRELPQSARWTPAEGGGRLAQRYSDYLSALSDTPQSRTAFALVAPTDATEAIRWNAFAQDTLGFVPTIAAEREGWQWFLSSSYGGKLAALNQAHGAAHSSFAEIPLPRDLPGNVKAQADWREFLLLRDPPATAHALDLWQNFLARRYRRISALNALYQTHWTDFDEIAVPDVLPRDGEPLADWYQYQTTVKPMQQNAHQFSVFIPTPGPAADIDEVQGRMALARRIVDNDKPAHTIFDVGFYWALFRVGGARLGFDTLLDVGSRSPQFMPPIVLGKNFVGESRLAAPPGYPGKERLTLECMPITQ
jgi:phage tail-like protein